MRTEAITAVPLCDARASYLQLRPEIDAAIARVLDSGRAILGPEVASLERETAMYCGSANAVGCSSGSDAILLALASLGIGPGDEVILPVYTFFATAGAVCRIGAIPVFVDIEPDTFNIDVSDIARRISPRTRALLPVHLFGQCADLDPLQRLARKHGIPVIEDAAQAFGSEYRGNKAGSMGEFGCFSFYPTKTLGTFGDGGMVLTQNAIHARRLTALREHGMEKKYLHRLMGWNARLDALHAAILRVKLPHVDSWINARRQAAQRYDELIDAEGLDGFLQKPIARPDCRHSFNQYVVRVSEKCRDELRVHLQADQIGCEVYYPLPLHLQDCLRNLEYGEGDFPVAEAASQCVLALPMFPELSADQQKRVIGSCAAFVRQRVARAA